MCTSLGKQERVECKKYEIFEKLKEFNPPKKLTLPLSTSFLR